MGEEAWHALSEKEVLKLLESSPDGLTEEQVQERLQRFGENELIREKKHTALQTFLDQFKSVLIIVLIAASVISFLLGDIVEGFVIFLIIMINTSLGFYQEYKAEKALEALKKMTESKAFVVRAGEKKEIPTKEIVPGDIIFFEEGKYISADVRLINAESLKVDESSLTGESLPVQKDLTISKKEVEISDVKNMVFSGTHVTMGHGQGIVVATGMQTQIGKIASMVQAAEEEKTPLQIKLESFGKQIGLLILFIISMVFLIGYYKHATSFFEMFLIAVSLSIAAIPEGLPTVVTLTLAFGTQKMAKQNAIVRKLLAVETLGAVSVICSDKTGTLTKNEMTVTEIFSDNKFFEISGSGYEPKGEFSIENKKVNPLDNKPLKLLLKSSVLCNNATFLKNEGNKLMGDPTEGALLVAAEKAEMSAEDFKSTEKFITELPFTSERKMMSKVFSGSEGLYSYVKGAPEEVLKKSTHIMLKDSVKRLDESTKSKYLEVSKNMASKPLRMLAVAYKKVQKQSNYSIHQLEEQLVFLGFIGMTDPPRPEVKDAIKIAKGAGIKTVMITGDHKITAMAIAKELGIFEKNTMVVTGIELEAMSQGEFEEIVNDVSVYARVTPDQKMKILQAFESQGHVVAMTGDGVNDAPALKRAHIGIAMGITGTDVAKGASDLVLQDDNYATIVSAVKNGRNIFDNIRKFMRFVLSANFSEVAVVTFASIAGMPLPITPLQILWINIVTDTLPATTLAIDPPDADIMNRPPRKNEKSLFTRGMTMFLATTTTIMCLTAIWVFLWGLQFGIQKARTMVFTTSVMFQLLLLFNCRSETKHVTQMNPFSNKYLIGAILGSFLLQLAVIYFGPLQQIFGTSPLNLYDWLIIGLFASLALVVSPKFFYKKEENYITPGKSTPSR